MAKCPNWKFCHTQHPYVLMDCWGSRCLNCDMDYGRSFTFVDTTGECPVCQETSDERMEFPGCPSGHVFCISCVKSSLVGSLEANLAILDEVCSSEHDDDPDYDPQDEGERLKAQLHTTKTCPLCRAPSTAPWHSRV